MNLAKLLAIPALICVGFAAPPVARITAVNGLLINGKQVPDKTAPTWPVLGNDTLATTANTAVLVLPKGDRALLDTETSVRVLDHDGTVTLDLTGGELCLLLHTKSTLQVYADGTELTIARPFQGSVTLPAPHQKAAVKDGGCRQLAGAFLGGKKVLIPAAAAGAAAAAATGKAITSASPSQP